MSKDILDDYLSGDSELTRLYAETKTPADVTPETEDAILATAKRELNTGPGATAQVTPRAKRWMLPLSAAAVVVLSATFYISNEAVIHSQAPDDDQSNRLESKQEQINPPAPAANVLKKSAPAEIEQSFELDRTQAKAKESRQRMAAPARSRVGASGEAPSPAAPAIFSDSAVSAVSADRAESAESAVRTESGLRSIDQEHYASPDAWLARIAKLLEQGDQDQAKTALDAFVLAYPDYSLPADAKALLTE